MPTDGSGDLRFSREPGKSKGFAVAAHQCVGGRCERGCAQPQRGPQKSKALFHLQGLPFLHGALPTAVRPGGAVGHPGPCGGAVAGLLGEQRHLGVSGGGWPIQRHPGRLPGGPAPPGASPQADDRLHAGHRLPRHVQDRQGGLHEIRPPPPPESEASKADVLVAQRCGPPTSMRGLFDQPPQATLKAERNIYVTYIIYHICLPTVVMGVWLTGFREGHGFGLSENQTLPGRSYTWAWRF